MGGIEIPRDESPARHPTQQKHKLGVIVCAGPLGEETQPDFTDNRYWVLWGRVTNTVATDAMELTEWAKGVGENPTDHGYDIVMVTNMAEDLEGSHNLKPGQIVQVFETADKTTNPSERRYYIVHPP